VVHSEACVERLEPASTFGGRGSETIRRRLGGGAPGERLRRAAMATGSPSRGVAKRSQLLQLLPAGPLALEDGLPTLEISACSGSLCSQRRRRRPGPQSSGIRAPPARCWEPLRAAGPAAGPLECVDSVCARPPQRARSSSVPDPCVLLGPSVRRFTSLAPIAAVGAAHLLRCRPRFGLALGFCPLSAPAQAHNYFLRQSPQNSCPPARLPARSSAPFTLSAGCSLCRPSHLTTDPAQRPTDQIHLALPEIAPPAVVCRSRCWSRRRRRPTTTSTAARPRDRASPVPLDPSVPLRIQS
jgi:hypothetical protein